MGMTGDIDNTITKLTAARDRLINDPALTESEVDAMAEAIDHLVALREFLSSLGRVLTAVANSSLVYKHVRDLDEKAQELV